MMEILKPLLRNFPVAWVWIIAGNERWPERLSTQVQYEHNRRVHDEYLQKDSIRCPILTMENERQNKQNFTVKSRKNWRNHQQNSLIDHRTSNNFLNILDKVRGDPRGSPNDCMSSGASQTKIGDSRDLENVVGMPRFGLARGPRKPRRTRRRIGSQTMGRSLVIWEIEVNQSQFDTSNAKSISLNKYNINRVPRKLLGVPSAQYQRGSRLPGESVVWG